MRTNLGLVPLSEGMFTSSSVLAASGRRDLSRGEPTGILSASAGNPTPAGPEREKGLLLAVLPKGADAADELSELRELTRTALVEPVAEVVQQRNRPLEKTYVGKGKLEELKGEFRRLRCGGAHRRRRARPDPAASARGCALDPASSTGPS